MQTFLPYADFERTVQVLDYRRLGKQRVESMQILNTLEGRSTSWKSHPIVQMWRGYEDSLAEYMDCCIKEWIRRGYNNTMLLSGRTGPKPSWFGLDRLHASHRAALLFKQPEWYNQYGWTETPELNYYWVK